MCLCGLKFLHLLTKTLPHPPPFKFIPQQLGFIVIIVLSFLVQTLVWDWFFLYLKKVSSFLSSHRWCLGGRASLFPATVGRVLGLLALHLESDCLWFSSFDHFWSPGIWCCTMEEWMRPIQSYTLCLILLGIIHKELNRDDGLDITSSWLCSFFYAVVMKQSLVKRRLYEPWSIHPHAKNMDGGADLQCFSVITQWIISFWTVYHYFNFNIFCVLVTLSD